MKKVVFIFLGIITLSSCLKEEPLTPNPLAGPTAQGTTVSAGGGTSGSSSFSFTLNGTSMNHANPLFSGDPSFGQIISKVSQTDYFQIAIFLGSNPLPDTTELFSGLQTVVYNETITKRYVGESGVLIVTDTTNKMAGSFEAIMYNQSDPNDSLIVTNGSFSVSR